MNQKPFSNPQTFELVFKEYFNALVNFINKYLNDSELSKDIVQSTFLKLWNNRDNIEIQSSVKSYIYQMTKNTMVDYIRKNNKMLTESLGASHISKIGDTTMEEFDPYLVRSAIEKSLYSVKEKTREIFILNKFEGLSYDEIADYLKISKRMVDYNVGITLKQLKVNLKDHPDLFN